MNTRGISFYFNVRFVIIVTSVLVAFGLLRHQNLSSQLAGDLHRDSAAVIERLNLSLPDVIWNYDDQSLNKIIEAIRALEIATFNLFLLKKNSLFLGNESLSEEVIEIIVIGAS